MNSLMKLLIKNDLSHKSTELAKLGIYTENDLLQYDGCMEYICNLTSFTENEIISLIQQINCNQSPLSKTQQSDSFLFLSNIDLITNPNDHNDISSINIIQRDQISNEHDNLIIDELDNKINGNSDHSNSIILQNNLRSSLNYIIIVLLLVTIIILLIIIIVIFGLKNIQQ
eukprot:234238_1